MRFSYLVRGWPGHPSHPPLTAVTIGAYTAAIIAAFIHVAGTGDPDMARTAGFLIQVGLFSTVPVAITGIVDFVQMPRRTPVWTTGLLHLIVVFVATILFRVGWGFDGTFQKGVIPTSNFALILAAYALMAAGGWLGGKIVFVFGHRVLAAEATTSGDARAR